MRKLDYLPIALVFGLVVVFGAGCMKCGENLAKKATEKALEAAVDKASGGKSNIDLSGNVDLSGLPDLLKYPGAKGTAKWSMTGDEETGTAYSLETADAKDVVVAWYKSGLESSGWKQAATIETAEGTSLTYGTADGKETGHVTISTSGAKTAIVVLYSRKP